jgi:hypothetical protein
MQSELQQQVELLKRDNNLLREALARAQSDNNLQTLRQVCVGGWVGVWVCGWVCVCVCVCMCVCVCALASLVMGLVGVRHHSDLSHHQNLASMCAEVARLSVLVEKAASSEATNQGETAAMRSKLFMTTKVFPLIDDRSAACPAHPG